MNERAFEEMAPRLRQRAIETMRQVEHRSCLRDCPAFRHFRRFGPHTPLSRSPHSVRRNQKEISTYILFIMRKKNMTDQEIRYLLDRFMEGLTTLEEERKLGEFFVEWGKKPHPENDDWTVYQKMFAYFDQGMAFPKCQKSAADKRPCSHRARRNWKSLPKN